MGQHRAALRREQKRLLLASVPVLVAAYFLVGEVGPFSERPFTVGVLLLPLAIAVGVLAFPLVRDGRLLLGGGFLPFFVCYCSLFSVAAGTRVLEGRRVTLAGFEDEAPSNVLGLNRLGDWHYWVAGRSGPASDLVVVLLPSFSGMDVNEARRVQMDLMVRAGNERARGIAFDFHLEQASRIDGIFCATIKRVETVGTPVIYAQRVRDPGGDPRRVDLAPDIEGCIAPERIGVSTGLLEADRRVRMVPTHLSADTSLRSFSYRIASLLTPGAQLPDVGLLQFVAPASDITVIRGTPQQDEADPLSDHFVVVGSDRAEDVHATPYGAVPGVVIHAWAAHALRTGRFIRRIDSRWLLPGIILLCYLLTLLQARGGVRSLLAGAGILSLAVAVAAVLAMRIGGIWIDASYPLLAVGGLTGILSGGARLHGARNRAEEAAAVATPGGDTMPVPEPFDVFLSHNSRNKVEVIDLAEALRTRGMRVWLDEWELVPGRPWQEAIEEMISTVKSSAVLVGRDGMGPWEVPEMRACLDECVRRSMPVIPVLLPGATTQPELPLFLARFTWVDLRAGLDESALDRLEWGITGIKPTSIGRRG